MARAEELFQRIKDSGEQAIDAFILDRQSEELFLDFKRSADHGNGIRLHQGDRDNLGKAVSGFGNSEGGVVVWGVDCSKDADGADVARFKLPLADAARFRSLLEGVVSGVTVPPHKGVQHFVVTEGNSEKGFVVTLIPKSNHAPHQSVAEKRYYIRAGSSFVPTPHDVLAGMFGRRPSPSLVIQYPTEPAKIEGGTNIEVLTSALIRNLGPGIARDIFLNFHIWSTPGPNCIIAIEHIDKLNWASSFQFGMIFNGLGLVSFRLAPEASTIPIALRINVAPPFQKDLRIEGNFGSSESPPQKLYLGASAATIETAYDHVIGQSATGNLCEDDQHGFVRLILGLPK